MSGGRLDRPRWLGGVWTVALFAVFALAPALFPWRPASTAVRENVGIGRSEDRGRPAQGGGSVRVAKGVFLVAEPKLKDPHFGESVVLIIDHGGAGTLGLIINRPTPTPIDRVLPEMEEMKGRTDRLYLGGPVLHDRLLVLFRSKNRPDSKEAVLGDVYFGETPDILSDLYKGSIPDNSFRVYAGHSGWAPGQLQGELARGDWRVVKSDPAIIFEENADLIWPEMIRKSSEIMVRRYAGSTAPIPVRPVH